MNPSPRFSSFTLKKNVRLLRSRILSVAVAGPLARPLIDGNSLRNRVDYRAAVVRLAAFWRTCFTANGWNCLATPQLIFLLCLHEDNTFTGLLQTFHTDKLADKTPGKAGEHPTPWVCAETILWAHVKINQHHRLRPLPYLAGRDGPW